MLSLKWSAYMGNTICCIKQLYYYHNTESKTYSILLLFFTSPITLCYDLIETKSKNSKGCNVCIHLYDLCVFPLWIDFGYKRHDIVLVSDSTSLFEKGSIWKHLHLLTEQLVKTSTMYFIMLVTLATLPLCTSVNSVQQNRSSMST